MRAAINENPMTRNQRLIDHGTRIHPKSLCRDEVQPSTRCLFISKSVSITSYVPVLRAGASAGTTFTLSCLIAVFVNWVQVWCGLDRSLFSENTNNTKYYRVQIYPNVTHTPYFTYTPSYFYICTLHLLTVSHIWVDFLFFNNHCYWCVEPLK